MRRRVRVGGRLRAAESPTPSKNGGARRDRTDDLMLAKHALSQLSYGPIFGKPQAPGDDIRRLGSRHQARRAFALAALCAGRELGSLLNRMVGLGRLELPT